MQASHLQNQVGGEDQRRRLLTRANAAEADYEHARQAAQRRDEASAEASERRTARLAEQHTEHERQARTLETEQNLRAGFRLVRYPPVLRRIASCRHGPVVGRHPASRRS